MYLRPGRTKLYASIHYMYHLKLAHISDRMMCKNVNLVKTFRIFLKQNQRKSYKIFLKIFNIPSFFFFLNKNKEYHKNFSGNF